MEKGIELHRHEEHERLEALSDWLWLTYRGGSRYKRGRDPDRYDVLPRYSVEDEDQHARRVAATPVLNVCGEFVRQRRDGVMRSQIVREQLGDDADASFAAWADDVDRAGRDLNAFMGARLLEGLVVGRSWYGIASPTEEALRGASFGDVGALPWAVSTPAKDVLDHDIEGDIVKRIAIRYCRRRKGSITQKPERTEHVIEWFPDRWVTYELKSGRLFFEEERRHAIGFVPWSFFDPLEGECYAERFADLQRSITQTRSDMIAEQKANTYTRIVFWGVNPGELADATGGPANGLAFDSPDGHLDRVGGDPAVMQELRANLEADVAEAYRRSELSSSAMQRQSRSPESGVAQAYRKSELSALLAGLAERTEAAEQRLIRMWAEVAGSYSEEQIGAMASSRYPREFDLLSDSARGEVLADLYTRPGVPLELKRAVLREEVLRAFPQDTQARDEVLEAIKRMQDSPARQLLQGRPVAAGVAFGAPAAAGATSFPDLGASPGG